MTEYGVGLVEQITPYLIWIDGYRAKHDDKMHGKCIEATKAMQESFPELKIVKGHVYCPHPWGKRSHAWCVTPRGDIVDPTKSQFPGIFEYEAWRPGQEVRVGKCMNCGDEIWEAIETLDEEPARKSICSKACTESFEEYLNEERRGA